MGIYLLHFLKQHFDAFIDLFYWRGLEKTTLHFDILSMKLSSHARDIKVKHGGHPGISFVFLFID